MHRIIVVVVAAGTLAGTALAQERTSARPLGGVASTYEEDGARIALGRCSGIHCRQTVPSLGVAF